MLLLTNSVQGAPPKVEAHPLVLKYTPAAAEGSFNSASTSAADHPAEGASAASESAAEFGSVLAALELGDEPCFQLEAGVAPYQPATAPGAAPAAAAAAAATAAAATADVPLQPAPAPQLANLLPIVDAAIHVAPSAPAGQMPPSALPAPADRVLPPSVAAPSRPKKRGNDSETTSVSAGDDSMKTAKQLRQEEQRKGIIEALGYKERSLSKEKKQELKDMHAELSTGLNEAIQSVLLKGLSRTEVNFGFTHVLVFIEGADNNIQRLTLPLQSDHQTVYHPNVLFFFVMYPGDSRDFFNEVELVKIPGTTLPVLAPVGVFNLRLASSSRQGIKTNAPAKRHLEVHIYCRNVRPGVAKPSFVFACNVLWCHGLHRIRHCP